MSLADELLKLQQLRDSGTLTDAEFELAKQKLLHAPSAAAAPAPQIVVPEINLLKEVDPAVTRVADKAVDYQGVTSVLGIVAFIIVASIIAFGACSMISDRPSPGDHRGPSLGGICDQPNVTCYP
ncbi:SHOCT domain-containing protein [Catellatospora sp. NPDC049609]|uniref:SHOCT domain-containing protein n=1 Tax=Catellatospora sp. NPDC049609 TaxID=3155505 RepID=UPI0034292BCD